MPIIQNPTSVLTRPANTTAYAQNDLIAGNVTAGSIVVPSLAWPKRQGAGAKLSRLRLLTNATTGWGKTLTARLWSAAPTYTNGDNGAYAVATGAAGYLGKADFTLSQWADGAVDSVVLSPEMRLQLAAALVYWDLQLTDAAGATPISGQTFTLTAEREVE
jgi:hypothetical protein